VTYDELSPILRAYTGTFVVLRNLGFPSSDIFIMTANSAQHGGVLSAFASLRTQKREFNIELGPIDSSEQDLLAAYRKLAEEPPPAADLDRMMLECEAWRRKIDLILALRGSGIRIIGDRS
jgi:hypothetical protein